MAVAIVAIALAYTALVIFLKKRAYRTHVLYLSIAFAVIAVGRGAEFPLLALGYSLTFSHAVESVITAAGLGTILYAIHLTRE